MAVGAHGHVLHHHAASGSPISRRRQRISAHGFGRQGLDHALLGLGGHQRHVAIEDGRADRVLRRADDDASAGDGAPGPAEAGDGHGGAAPPTERFLMALPTAARAGVQVCAAACSGVRRGGSLVSATQSGSIGPMRRRGPREMARMAGDPSANGDLDAPAGGVLGGVAPEEGGRRDFGREDGTVLGVIDRDGGWRGREGRRRQRGDRWAPSGKTAQVLLSRCGERTPDCRAERGHSPRNWGWCSPLAFVRGESTRKRVAGSPDGHVAAAGNLAGRRSRCSPANSGSIPYRHLH